MIRNLLRFLGWVCLLVLLASGILALVYFLSGRPQKVAIEQRLLDTVDIVREDGTTPRKVVDALDRFADQTAATSSWRRRRTRRPPRPTASRPTDSA
jgi:hypothetical protein